MTSGKKSGKYIILFRQRKGKRPLGRPRCRWKGDIKTDVKEMSCGIN